MKKVLFATTALVLSAGIASAEVSVGGWGYVGVTDSSVSGTSLQQAMRLTFGASVETDGGYTFAASSRITEADNGNDGALQHTKITVSNGGITAAFGATHGAMKSLARVSDWHGFNNGGTFWVDSNTSPQGDGGNNVFVSYAMGSAVVGASMDSDGATSEIAAKYSADRISIAAGVSSDDEWMAKAGYAADGMSINVGANSDEDLVVTAGYTLSDAASLSFAYENNTAGSRYGAQYSQNLGGGATLALNAGQTEADETVIGAGVQFSF